MSASLPEDITFEDMKKLLDKYYGVTDKNIEGRLKKQTEVYEQISKSPALLRLHTQKANRTNTVTPQQLGEFLIAKGAEIKELTAALTYRKLHAEFSRDTRLNAMIERNRRVKDKIKDELKITIMNGESIYMTQEELDTKYGMSEEAKKLRASPLTNPSMIAKWRDAYYKEYDMRSKQLVTTKWKIWTGVHFILTKEAFVEIRLAGYDVIGQYNDGEDKWISIVNAKDHDNFIANWELEELDFMPTIEEAYEETTEREFQDGIMMDEENAKARKVEIKTRIVSVIDRKIIYIDLPEEDREELIE